MEAVSQLNLNALIRPLRNIFLPVARLSAGKAQQIHVFGQVVHRSTWAPVKTVKMLAI
jgi:hypothetical protein